MEDLYIINSKYPAEETAQRVKEAIEAEGLNLFAEINHSAQARNVGIELRPTRSEEHTSELQSRGHLVCRLLLEKKKKTSKQKHYTTGHKNHIDNTHMVSSKMK